MKFNLSIILIALGFGACVPKTNGQVQTLGPEAFMQSYEAEEQAQLVDVRTPGEFSSGHLEGAQMIDYHSSGFQEKLAELDKEVPVYVYCRSGRRSAAAARKMAQMGFTKVVDMKGGIIRYSQTVGKP